MQYNGKLDACPSGWIKRRSLHILVVPKQLKTIAIEMQFLFLRSLCIVLDFLKKSIALSFSMKHSLCLCRIQSTELLKGKRNGTFLCRPTTRQSRLSGGELHTHTIDIM